MDSAVPETVPAAEELELEQAPTAVEPQQTAVEPPEAVAPPRCGRCESKLEEGRRYYCLQCTTLERTVHRKLGGWPEGLTPEEKKQFFQDTAKQLAGGRLDWNSCQAWPARARRSCGRALAASTCRSACGFPKASLRRLCWPASLRSTRRLA